MNKIKKFIARQIAFYHNNQITRLGKYYIGVCVLIGISAVNTGTNLLYLLFSILSAILTVNGILALLMFRKLELFCDVPSQVFAKQTYAVNLSLWNRKRLLPSYSLQIWDINPISEAVSHDYCLMVTPGQKQTQRLMRRFARRGLHFFEGLKVSSDFPFGLVQRTRLFYGKQKVLVYPNVFNPPPFLETNAPSDSTFQKRDFDEFYEIRPYTVQDDARKIYWKLSAKKQELLLKEGEALLTKDRLLAFLPLVPVGGVSIFESSIETMASLLWEWGNLGHSFTFMLPKKEVIHSLGREKMDDILTQLALLEPIALDEAILWLKNIPQQKEGILAIPKGLTLSFPSPWKVVEV